MNTATMNTMLCFAFGFLSPLMLGWLAAAAAPLVIHLWSRSQYREVPWAAMQYLLSAMQRRRRRLLFEQWMLLAIRMAIVALVVLAVAEPYFAHGVLTLDGNHRTHRVLVMDSSFSMAYRLGDTVAGKKSRFELAKQWAARIVEQSPRGNGFTLVVMAAPARVVIATPAFETGELLHEIEALRVEQTTADLASTLAAVEKTIQAARRDSPHLDRHEVIILTDLGRVGWLPTSSNNAEIRHIAERLAALASLTIIDLGQTANNWAVTDLRVVEPVITTRQNVHFQAQIKSFCSVPDRRTLQWFVDGQQVAQELVEVAPGSSTSVTLSYRFDRCGDHAIEARLDSDRLDVDDRRWLAVSVKETIRTLCIDGRPSGKSLDGAAGYLASALSPDPESHMAVPVQTEIVPESAIMERDLGRYDVVFLSNVAQLTASEARVLDAYLGAGGNLVFFLGDRVQADCYNRELTGLAGTPRILPVRLGTVAPQGSYRIDPLVYRHPAIQVFRGREKAGLLTTPITRYYRLENNTGGDNPNPHIVLGLTNGDPSGCNHPLIVESPIRRGRSVVVATSADLTWGAMPLWPSFVPLVHELVNFCVGSQIHHQNVLVGAPVKGSISAVAGTTTATIQRPDGTSESIRIDADGDYHRWNYAQTNMSGIYTVHAGSNFAANPATASLFAVNVDTAESDLARLSVDELRSEVWPGIAFKYQTTWQGLVLPSLGSGGGASTSSILLLYGALALVLAETFLAWRAGYHSS